jgi:hypothetical protein
MVNKFISCLPGEWVDIQALLDKVDRVIGSTREFLTYGLWLERVSIRLELVEYLSLFLGVLCAG